MSSASRRLRVCQVSRGLLGGSTFNYGTTQTARDLPFGQPGRLAPITIFMKFHLNKKVQGSREVFLVLSFYFLFN